MTGETNLDVLIKSMKPELNDGLYIFCTVPADRLADIPIEDILMHFREKEGITIIMSEDLAVQHLLEFEQRFSWITLSVHSSLSAVGLTAAFSAVLSSQNISCNVIAGYFHDHIFVDHNDSYRAISALKLLSATI
jgi:uncharacterized protein